ncbi:hypothetical protein FHN55_09270 [Streptomyces sp. NP160]|uniref:hypothetical protein n=1 Tax=Streptomyces sp. NP160 TaxID=2586637 RepID=UPI0011187284|nr:hypothetical protein [Streptomyces sp. NP160]TNM67626.1 hypothetical protein FHN55_09270 [Streptomyces sp. NP160]
MKALADLFDSYSRRARLYPALLVVLPLLMYLLPQLPGLTTAKGQPAWVGLMWPVLVTAGVPFLLVTLVRSRGKATQHRLLADWDGFSSTRALRHRDTGSPQRREHRRQRLQERLGVQLPTAAEEEQDPIGADEHYQLAVEQLIARVRAQSDIFPLVAEENAHYGFRRNLLGVKPVALSVLAACLVADLALISGTVPIASRALPTGQPLTALVLAVHAAMLLGWAAQVCPVWVQEAADDYTTRLYAALDDPRL